MKWVESLLPADKYEYFKSYYRAPVPTVEVTEKAFTELARALEGENQYMRAEFNNPANATDFEAYLVAQKEEDFWLDKAVEASKTQFNSVLIVDLAQLQQPTQTELPTQKEIAKPAPYFYLLEICPANIYDLEFKDSGVAEYIIFKEGPDKLYVFDDGFYRVYQKPKDSDVSQFALIYAAQHSVYNEAGVLVSGLGYCPARRFWADNLTTADTMQAKGPLAKVFGRFDEYIYDYVGLRYAEATGTYQVVWQYEDSEPKHIYPESPNIVCTKGYFLVPQPNAQDSTGAMVPVKPRVYPCAECKKNKLTGPGTVKTVSPPDNKVDADLRNPMGYITPEVAILEAADRRLQARKQSLITAVTGKGGEPTNNQARNAKDVEAGFENQNSFLLRYQLNIVKARVWVLETEAKLRYAADFLRLSLSYGNEFYLRSASEVQSAYGASKKDGLPDYMLAPMRDLISQTEYRENDEARMRQRILANIQPYPDRSDADIQAWITAAPQMLNQKKVRLRLDFDSYIRQFEREQQMSLVDFGSKVDFDTKIVKINELLLSYVAKDAEDSMPALPAPVKAPTEPIVNQ